MGNVNRYPRGLVSLLSLNSSGAAPDVLGAGVQAVVDLEKFWVQNQLERLVAVNAAVVPNSSNILFTVPAGEFWYVQNYSLSGSINAAGDSFALTPWLAWPQSDVDILGRTQGGSSSAANPVALVYAYNERIFFAPGGCTIGFFMSQKALAGNSIVTGSVSFCRLRS